MAAVAVLGMDPPDRTGYGRFRQEDGRLLAIVEERHADPELRRSGLCNAGVMAMDAARLPGLLAAVGLRAERRALVVRPAAVAHRLEGDALALEFDLPRGAFATSVLRELLDVRVPEPDDD